MNREQILDMAKTQVTGQRAEDYGTPENNFASIAALWTSYLGAVITPKDVALMMALLKIARAKAGTKEDNYVDLAGYAACAGELDKGTASQETKEQLLGEMKKAFRITGLFDDPDKAAEEAAEQVDEMFSK